MLTWTTNGLAYSVGIPLVVLTTITSIAFDDFVDLARNTVPIIVHDLIAVAFYSADSILFDLASWAFARRIFPNFATSANYAISLE